ncbi:MAG: TolC family protein [Longimicrobiales bacterium]
MRQVAPFALFISISLLGGISPVGAQQPVSLSLDDAIQTAKRSNPGFLSTANNVNDAAWQVREAYGQFLPSLTVNGFAQYEDEGVQRFGVSTLNDGSAGSTDYLLSQYSIRLGYQLDGNTLFRVKSARANSRFTEATVTAAEFTLESAVTIQYLAALRAREAVEVAGRQVARWEGNFELVGARVDAGAAVSTDGKQAEVDLGRARVTLLQSENLYRTEVSRLMEQMGDDIGEDVELASNFRVFDPDWDRDELLEMASVGHPSLRAFIAAESATGAQVNQARSSYFPTIFASATWSGFSRQIRNESFLLGQVRSGIESDRLNCEQFNALDAGIPGGLPGVQQQDCSAFSLTPEVEQQILASNQSFPFDFTGEPLRVQLQISFPIFQGFTKQRQTAQAQAQNRDARHNRRAEELRLKTAVTQSYDDLVTARASLSIQERNLEVASEQLELARDRYGFGAAPFLELLDAEDSMAQAERDHLAAVYDFHQAMWSLEAAVGVRLRPEETSTGGGAPS